MGVDRRGQGRVAEDRAAEYLLEIGYTVVTRRFQSRRGEIDLVVIDSGADPETLVFIEVKSRSQTGKDPVSAVDWTKRQHFRAAVQEYLDKTGHPDLPARYDVVAVDPSGLSHLKNAFRSDD